MLPTVKNKMLKKCNAWKDHPLLTFDDVVTTTVEEEGGHNTDEEDVRDDDNDVYVVMVVLDAAGYELECIFWDSTCVKVDARIVNRCHSTYTIKKHLVQLMFYRLTSSLFKRTNKLNGENQSLSIMLKILNNVLLQQQMVFEDRF